LQLWSWGDFQKTSGKEVKRVGILLDGRLLFCAQLVRHNFPLGFFYFYCPGGPLFSDSFFDRGVFSCFSDFIRTFENGKKIFLKIEPFLQKNDKTENEFKKSDLISSFKNIQPRKTQIIDLSKSEDELLSDMKQKTRYNINLARKKNIEIFSSKKEEYRKEFLKLIKETARRDKFYIHSYDYYLKMLDILDDERVKSELILAKYNGKIISANIIIFYNKTATYLHGASSNEYRNLMAPYLVHFYTMIEAKKRGFLFYDLWGIDEKKWPSLTRFKNGFGGEEVEYVSGYDLVFNKFWYFIYKIASRVRRFVI